MNYVDLERATQLSANTPSKCHRWNKMLSEYCYF